MDGGETVNNRKEININYINILKTGCDVISFWVRDLKERLIWKGFGFMLLNKKMERKQQNLFLKLNIMKYSFFLIITIFLSVSAHSQFELNTNPIKIETKLNKKDSSLLIIYKNTCHKDLLLWVGDWMIDRLEPNFEYRYLPNPIKNAIFLFSRKDKVDTRFLVYGDIPNRDYLLFFSNYKYLIPGESFSLKINCDTLIRRKRIKALSIYFNYSLVDISNLCLYSRSKSTNTSKSIPCEFHYDKRLFGESIINIDRVFWSCNRLPIINKIKYNKKPKILNGPIRPLDRYNIDPIIIAHSNNELITPSLEILYKFHRNYAVVQKIK